MVMCRLGYGTGLSLPPPLLISSVGGLVCVHQLVTFSNAPFPFCLSPLPSIVSFALFLFLSLSLPLYLALFLLLPSLLYPLPPPHLCDVQRESGGIGVTGGVYISLYSQTPPANTYCSEGSLYSLYALCFPLTRRLA